MTNVWVVALMHENDRLDVVIDENVRVFADEAGAQEFAESERAKLQYPTHNSFDVFEVPFGPPTWRPRDR
jgi:hypothetical protein